MEYVFVILLCCVVGIYSVLLNKEEGDICETINDENWICRAIVDCPQIGNVKVNRPDICTFRNKSPIICCPPNHFMEQDFFDVGDPNTSTDEVPERTTVRLPERTTMRLPERTTVRLPERTTVRLLEKESEYINATVLETVSVAMMKCLGYERRLCHNPTSKDDESKDEKKNRMTRDVTDSTVNINFRQDIVGGHPASIHQFTFMVAIGYGEQTNVTFECAGTMVSERWVLSSAKCAESKIGKAKWVALSVVMMSPELIGITLPIEQIVVHPSFKAPEPYHDIALFKLQQYVQFNDYMKPMCLNSFNLLPRQAIAAGWRDSVLGGRNKNVFLIYEDMNIVHSESCNSLYEDSPDLPRGYDNNTMFCAYEDNKNSIMGGGAVFSKLSSVCLETQLGIYSFRHQTDSFPGVYTRVSYYLPWIESIIWPNAKPK